MTDDVCIPSQFRSTHNLALKWKAEHTSLFCVKTFLYPSAERSKWSPSGENVNRRWSERLRPWVRILKLTLLIPDCKQREKINQADILSNSLTTSGMIGRSSMCQQGLTYGSFVNFQALPSTEDQEIWKNKEQSIEPLQVKTTCRYTTVALPWSIIMTYECDSISGWLIIRQCHQENELISSENSVARVKQFNHEPKFQVDLDSRRLSLAL